jgi:hypothetical protein
MNVRKFIAAVVVGTTVGLIIQPTARAASKPTKKTTKVAAKSKAKPVAASKPGAAAKSGVIALTTKGKGKTISPGTVSDGSAVPAPPTDIPKFNINLPRDGARAAIAALKKATTAQERATIWLGIYRATGIPVLDETGSGIGTGSNDPLGPPWWMVWSMSAGRMDQGIPLTDLARLMTRNTPGLVDGGVNDLVAGLRSELRSLSSLNVPSKFVAQLLAERFFETSKGILDENFDPSTARVDVATAQFFMWAAIRGALNDIGKTGGFKASLNEESTQFGQNGITARFQEQTTTAPEAKIRTPRKCSELFGDEQSTWIANWIYNKFLLSGITLPGGVDLGTFTKTFAKGMDSAEDALNGTVGKNEKGVKSVTGALGYANGVFAALSFALQFSGISVGGVAPELERTTDTRAGKAITVEVELWYALPDAMKGIPDGESFLGCAFNTLSNALGIGATLPTAGVMPGVSVKIIPGKGFNRIMFNNYKQIKQVADAQGKVDVELIGRPQPQRIKEPKAVDYVYSLRVQATTDPVDAGALFNFFFDTFTAVGNPSISGTAGVFVDYLRTIHWEFGELEAPLIDWEEADALCPARGTNFMLSPRYC